LSRTEPTTAVSRGERRAAEGEGEEERIKTVTEKDREMYYLAVLYLWINTNEQTQERSHISSLYILYTPFSSFQLRVMPTIFLCSSTKLVETIFEVKGSLLSHSAVTKAISKWNI